MRKVFKYSIPVMDEFTLELPLTAKPLTVQMQHSQACMWVLLNLDDTPFVTRRFRLAGTGHPIFGDVNYIGTFQMAGGSLVWHVFEMM